MSAVHAVFLDPDTKAPPSGTSIIGDDDIVHAWPLVYKALRTVVHNADETMPDVYTSLMEKETQLLVHVEEGMLEVAAIVEATKVGEKLCLIIRHLASIGLKPWRDGYVLVEKWAKEQGLDSVVLIRSRARWENIMKPLGYNVVVKSLTNNKDELDIIVMEKDL